MIVVKAHHPKKGQILKTFWSNAEAEAFIQKIMEEGYKPGLR